MTLNRSDKVTVVKNGQCLPARVVVASFLTQGVRIFTWKTRRHEGIAYYRNEGVTWIPGWVDGCRRRALLVAAALS